jgi:hypothetical protein
MPTVTRIKTAKVPFALATPKGSLVETDSRVPPPTVAEIALRLPATRKVRRVIANSSVREGLGQATKSHSCRHNGDETDA